MRFSNIQLHFAIKLDTNRIDTFANSFIPMTFELSFFPRPITLNRSRPSSTNTFDSDPIPQISFISFHNAGVIQDL